MRGLDRILDECQALMVMGPGGVGKTTCAAALALGAALRGKRTVVCTLDPARRLASSLGLETLASSPVPLPEAHLKRAGLPHDLPLEAMMLDVTAALERTIRRESGDPELASRIGSNRFFRQTAHSQAGVQRYAAVAQLLELLESGGRDLVVLDTPQTQHVLDFLQAPYRVVAAVDSSVLRWLLAGYAAAGRFSVNLLSVGRRRIIDRLTQVVGSGFIAELAEFVALMSSLLPTFKKKAVKATQMLKAGTAGYLVVSDPSTARMNEAMDLAREIVDDEMRLAGFVLNRVHRQAATQNRDRQASGIVELSGRIAVTAGLQDLAQSQAEELAGLLLSVHRDHDRLAQSDGLAEKSIRKALPADVPVVTIEMLDRNLSDLVDLNMLAQRFFATTKTHRSATTER